MDQRRGYASALASAVIWGFFPIYFHYLLPSKPFEILAHRVIWSALLLAVVTTVIRRWRTVGDLIRRPKALAGISLAAVLIGANWFIYIYGVDAHRVVEASLGYFINPLIAVVFGVAVFREHLRRAQWVAVGLGTLAVAVLAVDYGRPPWIALSLAITFALYGLVKKRLGLPPTGGLLVESSVLALPGLAYLAWLTERGQSTFTSVSVTHTVLLALSGLVTATPLLLYADAANRASMTSLGILQYASPVLQLAAGVFVLGEPMPPATLAGFIIVWLALAIFTWDGLRRGHSAQVVSAQVVEEQRGTVLVAQLDAGE